MGRWSRNPKCKQYCSKQEIQSILNYLSKLLTPKNVTFLGFSICHQPWRTEPMLCDILFKVITINSLVRYHISIFSINIIWELSYPEGGKGIKARLLVDLHLIRILEQNLRGHSAPINYPGSLCPGLHCLLETRSEARQDWGEDSQC